ncbi:hypothetical protein TSUD_149750 [Trifolium subterraneum]|uniref:Autophagy-related protein 27 n=1 Tax=Trifolium subterraneum TaxID=3900 RepID=A0A2Z6N0D8_TRISU|nr:hypothetical protein TSUD_149750 [Trifolium subterraneum]
MALVVAEQIFILIIFTILALSSSFSSATPTTACQFNFRDANKLYNYTLSSPIPNFPHGILSEDGFYKVSVNQTTLWFQLCDGMIFNHDPPKCADCWDCGGPTRCGMECSALVANKIGGYHVCATIGRGSDIDIDVIDKKNPHIGVIVKMSSGGLKYNCSLAVSVLCDLNGVQAPQTLERSGDCNYATELKHPSGCAMIVNVHGSGWGWFGTFLVILLCLFAVYLLAGIVYRYFFLKIRGIEPTNSDLLKELECRSEEWSENRSLWQTPDEAAGLVSSDEEVVGEEAEDGSDVGGIEGCGEEGGPRTASEKDYTFGESSLTWTSGSACLGEHRACAHLWLESLRGRRLKVTGAPILLQVMMSMLQKTAFQMPYRSALMLP